MKSTNPLPITVYTPESPMRHPARMLSGMFRDLLAGRELAWQLALRDIKAQYRQTALGLLWAFILPLAHTLTWIFLSGSGIVTVSDTALPYPVYVFTGTMIWAIFMDAVNAPLQQTIAAKHMLAKINFPREALVVSGIYQTLFNGAIKIALLLAALLFLGIHPDWRLAWFPPGHRFPDPGRHGPGPAAHPGGGALHGYRQVICPCCCNFSCTSPRWSFPCQPMAGPPCSSASIP